MAKLVIREEIDYQGTTFENAKKNLEAKRTDIDVGNHKENVRKAMTDFLKGTGFTIKTNPPTYGVEEEVDPGNT